jgi:hypothetical protein
VTYVSWAAFHEGPADAPYFDVLIPRLMEAIVMAEGVRHSDIPVAPAIALGQRGRAPEHVVAEICAARDAFMVVFIHADAGGRGVERGLDARSSAYCQRAFDLCAWPLKRYVTVTPKRETEAWILADPAAVAGALGYHGSPASLGLPADARAAERLTDPKATLAAAMKQVGAKRQRGGDILRLLPAIAQRRSIQALRASQSFGAFEQRLRTCLADIGCIAAV